MGSIGYGKIATTLGNTSLEPLMNWDRGFTGKGCDYPHLIGAG